MYNSGLYAKQFVQSTLKDLLTSLKVVKLPSSFYKIF